MKLNSPFLGQGSVSVVLPAFNEEGNIVQAVNECLDVLPNCSPLFEVLVVDDCSVDRTRALVEEIAGRVREVSVISNKQNIGLGRTLRKGFEASRGDFVFYTDSDLPVHMDDLVSAMPKMEHHDLLAGYRLNRDDGPRRYFYSWVYNRLIRLLFAIPVRDINFSFKLMKRELLQAVELRSEGSFIDAELLAEAVRLGFSLGETGVRYRPRVWGVSTLASRKVIFDILRELIDYRKHRFKR